MTFSHKRFFADRPRQIEQLELRLDRLQTSQTANPIAIEGSPLCP
jgi:hypothetical protein